MWYNIHTYPYIPFFLEKYLYSFYLLDQRKTVNSFYCLHVNFVTCILKLCFLIFKVLKNIIDFSLLDENKDRYYYYWSCILTSNIPILRDLNFVYMINTTTPLSLHFLIVLWFHIILIYLSRLMTIYFLNFF